MNLYDFFSWLLAGSVAIAAPIVVGQSPKNEPTATPAPTAIISSTPTERIRVRISVTALDDLKVRQGDQINKGQILADRDRERSRLLTAKREILRSLELIQSQSILEPPPPKPVPPLRELPEANYKEELAAIAQARIKLDQANRAYSAQEQLLKSEPLGESAQVERQRVKIEQTAQALAKQETKIVAVQGLQNLPQSVLIHEQEKLRQLLSEMQQEESELRLKQSDLANTTAARAERLQDLAAQVEQARGNLSLAEARLTTAQTRRAEQEYQHSLSIARRTEEENQSQQIFSRQLQETNDQRRAREFQVAQLQARVQDIDNQLVQIAAIRSPINGTIRRIKNLGQTNNTIDLELTIIGSSDRLSIPQEFTTPRGGNRTTPRGGRGGDQ